MTYVNISYAKTLVMANAKFVGRVITHQGSFNGSVTEFYKKLMGFATEIPENLIDEFEYIFAAPKTLTNTNLTDLISNAEQTATFIVKSLTGDNSSPSDDDNLLKDLLFNKISREFLPMIPWSTADTILEECKIELEKLKAEKKMTTPEGTEDVQ